MLFKSRKGASAASPAERALKSGPGSASSANGTVSVSQAPAGALSPEEIKRRANYSHNVMQAFGAIIAVYMRSKAHREQRLVDIENIVGPAVTTGQYSLAEATHKQNGLVTPVAVVLWASVSAAIDARISTEPEKPFSLASDEWKSGDRIWLVEAIGNQQVIGTMLQRLQATHWKGRTVKIRAPIGGGRVVTQILKEKSGG